MRWYYGWNVIAVALVFQAVTFGIALFSTTYFIPIWMDEFSVGRADLMWPVLAATLTIGVGAPFAGTAMDRLPIRYIVSAGGTFYGLGFLALSQAGAVWQIITIYALLVGAGLVMAGSVAGQTLAAKWFRGRRGLAVGLVTVGTSLGGSVFPPLVTFLIEAWGWREASAAMGGIAFLLIVPATLLIVRNSPEERGIEPDPEVESPDGAPTPAAERPPLKTGDILIDKAFWITVLAFLPASFVFSAVQQNLGPLADDLAIDGQRAASLMSTLSFSAIVGKLIFGAASDHVDNRYLFWCEAGLIVLSTYLLYLEPGYTGLLVACAVLGAAGGGTLPLLGSIIGKRFGARDFGRAMGLLMPFLTTSSFSYVIAAHMRDVSGNYDGAILGAFFVMIPAIIGMAFMPRLTR